MIQHLHGYISNDKAKRLSLRFSNSSCGKKIFEYANSWFVCTIIKVGRRISLKLCIIEC